MPEPAPVTSVSQDNPTTSITNTDNLVGNYTLPETPDNPLPPELHKKFHTLMDLAKELAGRGVLWDLLTENRCNEKNFTRLRVLIYQDISLISEAEVHAVREFLEQGGLVIAAGTVGDDDEWFRMRLLDPGPVWPPVGKPPKDDKGTRDHRDAFPPRQVGLGKLIYQPNPLTADQVITAVETHLGRSVQMIGNVPTEAVERLRLNAWYREDGGGTITMHVVNYNVPKGVDNGDQVQPLSNVQISVPVPPQMKANFVRLYSPESNDPSPVVPLPTIPCQQNGLISFEIPSLRIYTIAVIE